MELTNKESLRLRIKDIVVDKILNDDEEFKGLIRRGRNIVLDTNNSSDIKIMNYGDTSFVSAGGFLNEFDDSVIDDVITASMRCLKQNQEETVIEAIYEELSNETKKYINKDMFKMKTASTKEEADEFGVEVCGGSDDEDNNEDILYSFKDADAENCEYQEVLPNLKSWEYKYQISDKRKDVLNMLVRRVIKSFSGYGSKQSTVNPSKRLKARHIVSDYTDKIYETKKGNNGKRIDDVMFIIDTSGSMSGTPIRNAIEILYVFNQIAKKGLLTGKVIYSQTKKNAIVDFPYNVENYAGCSSAEGLGESINKHIDVISKMETVVCITDGDICDSPIDKRKLNARKIEITGIYANKDAEDLSQYTGGLSKWFEHSIVRRTTEEIIEKIIQMGLRSTRK